MNKNLTKKLIFTLMSAIIIINSLFITLYAEPVETTEEQPTEEIIKESYFLKSGNEQIPIYSNNVLLVEPKTDTIISEHNAYEKAFPASLTKILCALVALENSKLTDTTIVSAPAVNAIPNGYTKAGFVADEEVSMEILLEGLLLRSANEAANIIAEAISGSNEAFAEKMNERAKEIGCKNTHFVNGNGIHNEDHYTTAWDLYLITKECMKNEDFRRIVQMKEFTVPPSPQHPENDRTFKNTNKLMLEGNKYYYEGTIGIKTGFTSEAKNCYIGAVSRNGFELFVIIMGAPTVNKESQRYPDTIKLFDYGFGNYKITQLKKDNTLVKSVQIKNATKETKNLNLMLEKGFSGFVKNNFDTNSLTPEVKYTQDLVAPISAGTIIGTATYKIGNQEFTSNLVAQSDVLERSYYDYYILLGGISLFIIALIILIIIRIKSKKQEE